MISDVNEGHWWGMGGGGARGKENPHPLNLLSHDSPFTLLIGSLQDFPISCKRERKREIETEN